MAPAPLAYEHLPVGVLVLHETVLVHANTAASALIGLSPEELVGRPVDEFLPGVTGLLPTAPAVPTGAAADASSGAPAAPPAPAAMFVIPRGRRVPDGALRVVASRGAEFGEWVLTLVDADVEAATVPLVEAMVAAAGDFARCSDEHEVFEAAAEAIHARGYLNVVLTLDATRTWLDFAAMRQDADVLSRIGEIYGKPGKEMRFEVAKMPYLAQAFETGRAQYHADGLGVMRQIHLPEVAETLRQMVGPMRMVDAPIFVHGQPFGLLSIQSSRLTSASATTLELFARLLGGAVENVRHHREAATRAKELSELQRELLARERLAAVGQAAGLLSHEARNPLGAILNALAVLRRRGGNDAGSVELIDIAEEEALRLDALVRDLLELARPLEPRIRPTAVDTAIDAAIASLRRRSRSGLPPIEQEVPEALPEVHVDPTLLGVALENLLRNAVQAGGAGPVKVVAREDAGCVTVAVQDAGPPARRSGEGAFDPFSLESARGTGLGLAVVKRVADAQGATVRATREGTRLELSMPVVPSAATPPDL